MDKELSSFHVDIHIRGIIYIGLTHHENAT